MARYPEAVPNDVGGEVVLTVSERFAIVGEDPTLPLEGLRVIKKSGEPRALCRALTISVAGTAEGSLVTSDPIHVQIGEQLTLTAHYTRGADGGRPIIFPQINVKEESVGMTNTWSFLPGYPSGLAALPVGFPAMGLQNQGHYCADPWAFRNPGASEEIRTAWYRSVLLAGEIRFAMIDTSVTAGTITLLAMLQ